MPVFHIILTLAVCASGAANSGAASWRTQSQAPGPPSGLMCELLADPHKTVIHDAHPDFCWIVNGAVDQSAYQILVASDSVQLERGRGDLWDSGRVNSPRSVHVEYRGRPLQPHSTCFWKVRIWDAGERISPYSEPQFIRLGDLQAGYRTAVYPLEREFVQTAVKVRRSEGHYFFDFGRAAFGTLQMTLKSPEAGRRLTVHLGEKLSEPHCIDTSPGATIRYRETGLPLEPGLRSYTLVLEPDERNTRPGAILMPPEIGEVLPFRYAELIGVPSGYQPADVRQIAVHYPFDEDAAEFESSDAVLNDVWALCRYSIKATSFCGLYVDGDRERIPYEADAYINQLGHYSVDREFSMARASHEHLITHPTWPTEWILHSVLMAWADYLYSGDPESMERYYHDLRAKTLMRLARSDGLISTRTGLLSPELYRDIHFSGELRDIVDWPSASFARRERGERDGYEMTDINTVVNAFHYRALEIMAEIARALGRSADAARFRRAAARVHRSFNRLLFDAGRGVYVDGEGSAHASLHANAFPLAFGLVPPEAQKSVAEHVLSRGMACSVYGAQYLLEALYRAGEAAAALRLMTARDTDRSWPHMIYDLGSTITLEAWDAKYKPNLDWNHAWGAAPANIIPRCLMGIKPLEPGFRRIQISPQPAGLSWARMRLPTVRGDIRVRFESEPGSGFRLWTGTPGNTRTTVVLPDLKPGFTRVLCDGKPIRPEHGRNGLVVRGVRPGEHEFIVQINRP